MAQLGNTIQTAGHHEEGHRDNRNRFSDVMKGGFLHWVRKRLPTAGSQNYAFESLGLAEFTPIGAAVGSRMMLQKTQPPQSYLPINAVLTNGLGGLVAGQIALQGLYDPNTGTYQGQPLTGG